MAQPHEVPHGWMHGRVFKLKKDTVGYVFDFTTRKNYPFTIAAGTPVKVVMVSRMGDCGITKEIAADLAGYTARVMPEDLEIV